MLINESPPQPNNNTTRFLVINTFHWLRLLDLFKLFLSNFQTPPHKPSVHIFMTLFKNNFPTFPHPEPTPVQTLLNTTLRVHLVHPKPLKCLLSKVKTSTHALDMIQPLMKNFALPFVNLPRPWGCFRTINTTGVYLVGYFELLNKPWPKTSINNLSLVTRITSCNEWIPLEDPSANVYRHCYVLFWFSESPWIFVIVLVVLSLSRFDDSVVVNMTFSRILLYHLFITLYNPSANNTLFQYVYIWFSQSPWITNVMKFVQEVCFVHVNTLIKNYNL